MPRRRLNLNYINFYYYYLYLLLLLPYLLLLLIGVINNYYFFLINSTSLSINTRNTTRRGISLGTLFLIFVNRIAVSLHYMLLLLVVLGTARVEENSRAKRVSQSLLDESRIHS